jgi:hypothetical protein
LEGIAMFTTPADHPLRRLFAGITEHAFISTLGVADPPLVDYVSDLLSRFVHVDAVFRLRDATGRPLSELAEMAMEAEKLPPEGRTRREYHRHIGDFALYWSGLFPEEVNRFQYRPSKDHLVSFAVLGKRSYRLAADCDRHHSPADAQVLRRLGDEFELCAVGLNEVRKEWDEMARHPCGDGRIIR